MSRLYKRHGVWWGYWRDAHGKKTRRSLHTTDRAIARDRLREREAGQAHRAAHAPTLKAALKHLIDIVYKGRSPATISCYTQKGAHLLRLLGDLTPITDLDRAAVLTYRATRLDEGAADGTVYKEIVVLRLALAEAGITGVVPRVSANYVPRTTHLTPEQFTAVIATLPEHRRLWIALAVYGGLRRGELERLRWEEIGDGVMRFASGKTRQGKPRMRVVPIAEELAPWLEDGGSGPVLEPWPNLTRDLKAACKRVGAPPCSCNDLRRTFCSWLKQAGVDSMAVARLMGHTSTRMVEAVYAQLTDETLRAAIARMPRTPGVHQTSEPVAAMTDADRVGMVDKEEGNARGGGQVGETAVAPTARLELATRGLTGRGLQLVAATGKKR